MNTAIIDELLELIEKSEEEEFEIEVRNADGTVIRVRKGALNYVTQATNIMPPPGVPQQEANR